MLEASCHRYELDFKKPSGTSRGVLRTKETWFIVLREKGAFGIGECGLLRGLSMDDRPDYESKLRWVCDQIDQGEAALYEQLIEFPSIQFGLEMAFKSLKAEDSFVLFPSEFTKGEQSIPINGLIWMGDKAFMKKQIVEKISSGFNCIKMKIGAIDFATELELLQSVRREFTVSEIEIRVDANGAFHPSEALEKLKVLSELELHSIEQPIKQGQWEDMAGLCEYSPLPIALDEELIGVLTSEEKNKLLQVIKPPYIILKPSFIGGYKGTDSWISLAHDLGIQWWLTSALESNVGLNAISQYSFTKNSKLPQGLGTGSLYTNNFPSPLGITNGSIYYEPTKEWDLENLDLLS